MPVIVIGADTPAGDAIVDALLPEAVEVRVFISDEDRTTEFKERGTKVATGDVSDASHVEGAAMRCFCAVMVVDAAEDDRTRSFANDPETTLAGWANAVRASGVTRVIWVGPPDRLADLPSSVPEVAHVPLEGDLETVARQVSRLEEAASI